MYNRDISPVDPFAEPPPSPGIARPIYPARIARKRAISFDLSEQCSKPARPVAPPPAFPPFLEKPTPGKRPQPHWPNAAGGSSQPLAPPMVKPAVPVSPATQPSARSQANPPAVKPPVSPSPNQGKSLVLPRFKPVQVAGKPTIAPRPLNAMHVLRDIEATIISWQHELEALLDRIEAIYDEGPIINGWLETPAASPPALQSAQPGSFNWHDAADVPSPRPRAPRQPEYFLCQVDAHGEVQCQPCPATQVPGVSLAIARYNQVQDLVRQRQHLEQRLNQLAQLMLNFYGQVQAIARSPSANSGDEPDL